MSIAKPTPGRIILRKSGDQDDVGVVMSEMRPDGSFRALFLGDGAVCVMQTKRYGTVWRYPEHTKDTVEVEVPGERGGTA